MSVLKVENISCGFENPLFSDLSFELLPGQAVQILGANGSGKTTMLRCLLGLFPLMAGSVKWFGQELAESAFVIGERVSFQSFELALKKQLTALENLELYLSVVSNPLQTVERSIRRDKIEQVLQRLELSKEADVLCQHLSSGQLRRLSLSKLILNPVDVWVLDEPFAAVDKAGVALLQSILNEHVSQGGSVVFTSHQDIVLDVPIMQVHV